jgi:hypothetical protein
MAQRIYPDAAAALDGLLHDGMTIAAGGFGLCGIPERLIERGEVTLAGGDHGARRLEVAEQVVDFAEHGFALRLAEHVPQLAEELEALLGDAAPLVGVAELARDVPEQAQAPAYHSTNLADLRTMLLEEATKDARPRAEAIVRTTGPQIGAVREARMGVFQITPRFSTEIADYGINDVSSIEKDVTAVVRVTFTIR